jgi:predicted cupin superfamily sugar epimerase
MHPEARLIVDTLGLEPHPEGGFYRETFRAPLSLEGLPHGGPRAASTAIYFLLPAGVFSALHRVRSDEVWHHYDGDMVHIHEIDDAGTHTVVRLGPHVGTGERPQHVVTAGKWQAAVVAGARYALCGCTVAPGFDFRDFEMPSRAALLAKWPSLRLVVETLTRA